MRFKATVSTKDGRLKAGKNYQGSLVVNGNGFLRIAIYDNNGEWMTFDPVVFAPVKKLKELTLADIPEPKPITRRR